MSEPLKGRRWLWTAIGLTWVAVAVAFMVRPAEGQEREPTPRDIARLRMLDEAAEARQDTVNQWSWVEYCPGRVCLSRMECERIGGEACTSPD